MVLTVFRPRTKSGNEKTEVFDKSSFPFRLRGTSNSLRLRQNPQVEEATIQLAEVLKKQGMRDDLLARLRKFPSSGKRGCGVKTGYWKSFQTRTPGLNTAN